MNITLYVANLNYNIENNDLEQLFALYGKVRSAKVITDRETGRSKGFGFVEMSAPEEAQAAIAGLNGKDFAGRNLLVNEAHPQEGRKRRPDNLRNNRRSEESGSSSFTH